MIVEQSNKTKLRRRKRKACTIQTMPDRSENNRQEEQIK